MFGKIGHQIAKMAKTAEFNILVYSRRRLLKITRRLSTEFRGNSLFPSQCSTCLQRKWLIQQKSVVPSRVYSTQSA